MNILITSLRMCSKTSNTLCVCAALVLISACSGSGNNDNDAPDSADLIIGESTGGDASQLSDEELLRSAFETSDAALSTNLNNLNSLPQSDDDESVAPINDVGTLPDAPLDGTPEEPDNTMNSLLSNDDLEPIDTLDDSSTSFLLNTLGLDETGSMQTGATFSREGNVVTVRPDANEVCGDEIPLADGLNDNVDSCRELVNDLAVEVDAVTTETGVITYLFDDSPVLLIGYSTTAVSYELQLNGMFELLERSAQLNNEPFDASTRLSGAFRLAATVLNDQPGSEASSLSLDVSEPISSSVNDLGESFSLQNSTVFSIAFDGATQDITTAIDWGALQIVESEEDEQGNTRLNEIELGGLSAAIQFNENDTGFVLSNAGIGNGLTITIGDAQAARVNLQQFGVTVDEGGVVTLDGAFNASLVLDNMSGWLGEYATNFSSQTNLNASDGAMLSEQNENGVYLIQSGQLSSDVTVVGDDAEGISQNESSSVSAITDQCVESNDDEEDSEQPLAIVICP